MGTGRAAEASAIAGVERICRYRLGVGWFDWLGFVSFFFLISQVFPLLVGVTRWGVVFSCF